LRATGEMMKTALGHNSYGKGRVRVAKVTRHEDGRHDFREMTVDVRVEGDFEAAHLTGDNTQVLPTDTMKNTVYALARMPDVDSIERFAAVLADHFLGSQRQIERVTIEISERAWPRLVVDHKPHPHTFVSERELRTTRLVADRDDTMLSSGLCDLVV